MTSSLSKFKQLESMSIKKKKKKKKMIETKFGSFQELVYATLTSCPLALKNPFALLNSWRNAEQLSLHLCFKTIKIVSSLTKPRESHRLRGTTTNRKIEYSAKNTANRTAMLIKVRRLPGDKRW